MTTTGDLKQQLKELETRRSSLENEVSLARARLEATGLGMDEPLIDNEVGMRGLNRVHNLSRVGIISYLTTLSPPLITEVIF